ncbi:MAG: hypothetical protein ACREPN_02175 [Rudaea sp.]
MNPSSRNRLILIVLVALFALPLFAAFALRSGGWQPHAVRSSGTLVDPPRDLSAVLTTLTDGSRYAWRDPHYRWTLLLLPGQQCGSLCRTRMDEALRMRITLGRNADRLRVLYLGPALPENFVAARAPLLAGRDDVGALAFAHARGDDALAVALVDPNAQLMLRYADGYSAQGLRSDIVKVIY